MKPLKKATIRLLTPEDVPVVVRFCAEGFRDDPALFARILSPTWDPQRTDKGAILEDQGRMVGFAIALYSHRILKGAQYKFCALGPWYVLPDYRVGSLQLMSFLLAQKDYTFTSHSPNDISLAILTRFKFERLSTCWYVYPLGVNILSLARGGVQIDTNDESILSSATEQERFLINDHRPGGCSVVRVSTDGSSGLVITKRRTLRNVPVSELLYVEDPHLVVSHFERVKWAIARKEGTFMLIADSRLLGPNAPRPLLWRERVRMFRSEILKADEIDNLYSEVVAM